MQLRVFGCGVDFKSPLLLGGPSPGGSGTFNSNTLCHWTPQVYLANWHLNPSNGLSRVHKGNCYYYCYNNRQTDDRQTDHTTEKCVAVGVIACTRAIQPNDNSVRVVDNFVNDVHQDLDSTARRVHSTCGLLESPCRRWRSCPPASWSGDTGPGVSPGMRLGSDWTKCPEVQVVPSMNVDPVVLVVDADT